MVARASLDPKFGWLVVFQILGINVKLIQREKWEFRFTGSGGIKAASHWLAPRREQLSPRVHRKMECSSINGSTSNACSEVRNLPRVMIACQTDEHIQEGCISSAIE